ncbi:smalltalk protein [Prevotella copri]|nr:smalltalk protein [Segatella copri]MBV3431047.1 smalltalk protein [Segatella copri]
MNLNDVHNRKISWTSVLYAVLQALIAALTALGVSSCTLLMND